MLPSSAILKYPRLWATRILITLLPLSIATTIALGQPSKQSGQIAGTVRDIHGQAISAARIDITAIKDNATHLNVLTDANGRYGFANLRYGTYTLTATSSGYRQSEAKSFTVTSATATVDFNLMRLLSAGATRALNSKDGRNEEKQPPTFTPAGIQGTIAPSGYSAAASEEEASQVQHHVGEISNETLSDLTLDESIPSCDYGADLVKAAQMHPESFTPNHLLGIFYLIHNDLSQGIHYLELASKANFADINNSRDLAIAYIKMKQYPDAIALLQRATESQKNNASLLRLLAIAYEASGDSGKSADEYLQAAALDPSEPNLLASGIGLIRLGAIDKAMTLFSSATTAHPGSAKLWMGLGIAQDLQQHKADAIQSLIKSIDTDPGYLPSYSFLAPLYGASTKEDAQIINRFNMLLRSHPESALAHYNYALILWKQRESENNNNSWEEVESQLLSALAKDPKLSRAHFQLGVVYASSGDYANAAKELHTAILLEPLNAETHYRLAQAYRRTKQTALADAELRQFQALKATGTAMQEDLGTDIGTLIPQQSLHGIEAAPCQQTNR